jgi:3-deoxy-manno-octulosonate cytidylyltransferase (CMP-KDO synthetase)
MEKQYQLMEAGLMLKAVGLIPTRFNSRRLPGKSLKMIGSFPMIIHTYLRSKIAKSLDKVYICCDTKEVFQVAKKYNADVILTSKNHKQGGDRIYEAYSKLKKKYDQVIDIQGDEPLIDPKNIDYVVKYHRKNKKYDIILPNLKTKYSRDPNLVRLIFNKHKEVLYLTRSDTPYHFVSKTDKIFKHLSVISFKPQALKSFANYCHKSKLENLEDIELLRAIDLGLKIKTFSLKGDSFSIDIFKNLIQARKRIKFDKYYKIYKKKYDFEL